MSGKRPMEGALVHLLASLEPRLHAGAYAYCQATGGADAKGLGAIVTVVEPAGITLVLPEAQAIEARLAILFRAAWITLTVRSELQASGLTAAFSAALADAGIACNVVAGVCHDHLFVPYARRMEAMAVLRALQQRNAAALPRRRRAAS